MKKDAFPIAKMVKKYIVDLRLSAELLKFSTTENTPPTKSPVRESTKAIAISQGQLVDKTFQHAFR